MANQYTVDPAILKELQDWKTYRDSVDPNDPKNFNDPAFAAKYNGDNLSAAARPYTAGFNPATGKPYNGVDGQHFDIKSGQIVKNKGAWQLPETYAILGLAGGLGAAAIPAIVGASAATGAVTSASAAAPAAATGTGTAATIAGTAAAAAPKAVGGISNWLTSPTGNLVNAGIGAAGNIFGTIEAGKASKDAQDFQEKQFDAALQAQKEKDTYDRNQYGAYLSRLQGFSDTGNASNGRMPTNTEGSPLHPSATAPPPMPSSTPGGPPAAPFVPPPQGAPLQGGAQQPQTVKMVGPDGSMRDIPADQVPRFQSLGAKIAQQPGA
jgi:hypothetical protein